MIKLKEKIIKLIGGVTRSEHDRFRRSCELFARDHLVSRHKLTCFGNGELIGGEVFYPVVVVGSYARISGVTLRGLYVAPWVNYFSASNIRVEHYKLSEPKRSFLEVKCTENPALTKPPQGTTAHDNELLNRFSAYLNKRCDINVANMVRPFLEGDQ